LFTPVLDPNDFLLPLSAGILLVIRKVRVFENVVLRRIFGPRRDEVRGNGGDYIARS